MQVCATFQYHHVERAAMTEALSIFISYAHADEPFKDQLLSHLIGLQRKKLIKSWTDRQIDGGATWRLEIDQAMDDCRLALLLVSPAFMASDFIHTQELARLLERRRCDGIRVVPIIIRPCLWRYDGKRWRVGLTSTRRWMDLTTRRRRVCGTCGKH